MAASHGWALGAASGVQISQDEIRVRGKHSVGFSMQATQCDAYSEPISPILGTNSGLL